MSSLQLRSWFGISAVAALALCAGAATSAGQTQLMAKPSNGPVSKDGQKGKQQMNVEGILTVVATDGTSITIMKKNGMSVAVKIDATTKIEQNEMNITVTQLAALIGDRVEAKVSTATGVATKVEVGE